MGLQEKVIIFLQSGANDFWTGSFKLFSFFGSWFGFIVLFLFLFIKKRMLSYIFALTYWITIAFQYLLKILIAHERPFLVNSQIQQWTSAVGNSMPSGHSVSAIILAVFACLMIFLVSRQRVTKILTYILSALFVCLVGMSRIYLGVHFPSDVFAGFAIGVIFCGISIFAFHSAIFQPNQSKFVNFVNRTEKCVVNFVKNGGNKLKNKEFKNFKITTNSVQQTISFAKDFSKALKTPAILILDGDLGSGKTHFVKGLAKGFGYKGAVTSPTFTILNTYFTKKCDIHHFDMYRLKDSQEAFDSGFEEYFDLKQLKGITVVEWAEKTPELLGKRFIRITINKLGENKRQIIIKKEGEC